MPDSRAFDIDIPPDSLDALADVMAVCGGVQSAIAIETALERLLHDLPWRLTRAQYGDAASEVTVLLSLAVRARRALARAGSVPARRLVSSVWSWYAGAMRWNELVQLLAEQLGHTVVGGAGAIELDPQELEPWDGTLASILQNVPDSYADQLAADAERFLADWWRRLCDRLAFRDALAATLEWPDAAPVTTGHSS